MVTEDNKNRLALLIADRLGVDSEQVKEETNFKDDLEADSLDMLEIVMEVEIQFDITIPDAISEQIRVVRDFYPLLSDI